MLLSDVGHHQQRLAPRALYLQTVGAVYPGKTGEEACSAMAVVYGEEITAQGVGGKPKSFGPAGG